MNQYTPMYDRRREKMTPQRVNHVTRSVPVDWRPRNDAQRMLNDITDRIAPPSLAQQLDRFRNSSFVQLHTYIAGLQLIRNTVHNFISPLWRNDLQLLV